MTATELHGRYRKAVEHTILEFYELCERRYCGDYEAVATIVDLLTAVKQTDLTDRQLEAIWLASQGYSQEDSGVLLGVSQQAFSKRYQSAIRKIAQTYEDIERRNAK